MRGDVWTVDLELVRGSEMSKQRPCVVVSNDVANRYSPVVTVIAITSQIPKKPYPFMVEIPESAKMSKKSWVTCAHIRTVDKTRLSRLINKLDSPTIEKVGEALLEQLGMR
jgi:mRNA interferase MazF